MLCLTVQEPVVGALASYQGRYCRPIRPLFGLFLLGAVASSRAQDTTTSAPRPLQEDLKKLQGTWEPVKPIEKVGYVRLEFDKAQEDGKDYLAVIHAVDGGGKM